MGTTYHLVNKQKQTSLDLGKSPWNPELRSSFLWTRIIYDLMELRECYSDAEYRALCAEYGCGEARIEWIIGNYIPFIRDSELCELFLITDFECLTVIDTGEERLLDFDSPDDYFLYKLCK